MPATFVQGSAGKSGTGFKVVGEVAPEHRPALHPWSAENAVWLQLSVLGGHWEDANEVSRFFGQSRSSSVVI